MAKRKEVHRTTPRVGRRPNALKHGAFAESEVLPGEDARELERLLDDVFAEWQPSGPVEEDAARSLASAIWRKARLGIFARAERARATYAKYLEVGADASEDHKLWLAQSQVLETARRDLEDGVKRAE